MQAQARDQPTWRELLRLEAGVRALYEIPIGTAAS